MDALVAAAGGVGGLALGAVAVRFQHLLYRQPEYRAGPAHGRRLLAMQGGAGVAASAAGVLALRPDHYDPGPALLTAAFSLVLIVFASTDLERRIIPNRLLYPSVITAALLCWAWPDRSVAEIWLGASVALGAAGLFFALGIALGNALGLGDVKLALLLGLLLGWPAVVYGLFLGVLFAGLPAFALMLRGRGGRYFSYGPYLALGGIIVLLWPGKFI